MKKTLRRLTALFLVFTVVASMSVPSYAGLFDKLKKATDWVEGAAEDTTNWVEGAAEDTTNWVEGAAEDTTNWVEGAAEDTADWTVGAAKDTVGALETAAGWTAGAAKDAYNWTEGATKDTGKWLEGAAEDTGDWLATAAEDVGDFAIDVFTEAVNLSELETLPVLEVDESQMVDMLDSAYGKFSYLDNVRDKKLSSNSYIKIKDELKKIGIPGHIIDFILGNVAGVDGDNIGGAIANLLPGSIIYGDAVAGVINEVVNNEKLEDIDFYNETIKSNSGIDGFRAYYEIPINGEIKKNVLVIATGLKYGKRDDFIVNIKTVDSSGKESIFPVKKMAVNGREVGFVSEITNISTNIEKIRVEYINSFDKPKEPSRLIADGIKDGLNGASPFGSPISNSARDQIVKVLDKADMNELGGNGDVGLIIANNIVAEIPLVGTALQIIGGIDWLAELIRKVVGQVEVKSYAAIMDGRILVKGYTSSSQLNNFVDGATKESADSSIRTIAYDYENSTPDFKYFGSGWLPGSTLYCITNSHSNTVLDGNDYGNFAAETTINLNESRGNAGIEFRIGNVGGTANKFQGYLAGIGFDDKNQGKIFLGKQNYDWKSIKEVNAPITVGKDHVLRVVAVGENIKVYLDGKLYLDANDNSYRDGYIGYQVWNTAVNFDNFVISENVPFDSVEYNFASEKPNMNFTGDKWYYYEDDSSTKLRCYAEEGKSAAAVLGDKKYGNFIADTQISKITGSGAAGLGFRLQSTDTSKGYIAGLQSDSNGNKQVYLGKADPTWVTLKTANVDVKLREEAKLTVVAHGNNIQVFVNGKLMINTIDDSFSSGYIGYGVYSTDVLFDNLEIKESELKVADAVNNSAKKVETTVEDNGSKGIFILNTQEKNITDVNFAISFTYKGQKYYTNKNFGNMKNNKEVVLKLNDSGKENGSGFIMGDYFTVKNVNGVVPGVDVVNAVGNITDVGIAMEFKMDSKKYVVYKQFANLDTTNMFELIVEGGDYFEQGKITRGDYLVPTY